jgi:hypothetical protein
MVLDARAGSRFPDTGTHYWQRQTRLPIDPGSAAYDTQDTIGRRQL